MSITAVTTTSGLLQHVQNEAISQNRHIHQLTKSFYRANIFVKIALIAATAIGMIALTYFYPPSLFLTVPNSVYLGEKVFSAWKEVSEFNKMQKVFGGEGTYNQIPTVNLDGIVNFDLITPTMMNNGNSLQIVKGIKYGRPALALCVNRGDGRMASLCLVQITSFWKVIHASNCDPLLWEGQEINSNNRETLRALIEGSR